MKYIGVKKNIILKYYVNSNLSLNNNSAFKAALSVKTIAPIGAWKCNFSSFEEITASIPVSNLLLFVVPDASLDVGASASVVFAQQDLNDIQEFPRSKFQQPTYFFL